mmetsp:Transcript_23191/g.60657  ORF Transcript_23191/g.60657 Transcript_23191/m.60657 type:complete len:359 (-) Transcript_23191:246-1322(-)
MAMNLEKPQIIELAAHSVAYTLFDAKFVPSSARLVALGNHARNTGAIELCAIEDGRLVVKKKHEKPAGFKCGTFGGSRMEERHLATGDFKGNLAVWDLERMSSPVYHAKAHEAIVNCIDGCGGLGIGGGAPELVTGGRDGCVKVWDVRQKDHPVANMGPADAADARDCWSVAFGNSFNDDERCVVAGYDNGDIKMFDLRTMSVRWETHLPNGVISVEFDRKDIRMNKLLTTGLDSKFDVFDLRTQHKERGFASLTTVAHKSTIWCGAHLPQNRDIFMTAGGNGSLHLWKYKYPAKRTIKLEDGTEEGVVGSAVELNRVSSSTQPIFSFEWSPDKPGLCLTTAADQTLRVMMVTRLGEQ